MDCCLFLFILLFLCLSELLFFSLAQKHLDHDCGDAVPHDVAWYDLSYAWQKRLEIDL